MKDGPQCQSAFTRIGKDIVMAVKERRTRTRFNARPKGSNPELQGSKTAKD